MGARIDQPEQAERGEGSPARPATATSGAHALGSPPHASVEMRGQDLGERDLRGVELHGADLREVTLRGAKLRNRDLTGADLTGADLSGTDLSGAQLEHAKLQRAIVRGASFARANLAHARLTDSEGLSPSALAGANLNCTSLPEQIRFEALYAAEETSKNCRTLFIGLLLASLYCLLTIGTTSDANLKLATGTSQLPFLDVHVPALSFYQLAPWLLLAVFVYLQLYMQRLWDRVASLPAVFHDGRRLDEAMYPWLIAGLVRTRVEHLRTHRVAWAPVQAFVACVLGWMAVPAVLAALWWRTLPAADPGLSLLQGVAVVLAVVIAYWTWREGMLTLSQRRFSWPHLIRIRSSPLWTWAVALILAGATSWVGWQVWEDRPQAHVLEYDADLRGRWLGGDQSVLRQAVLPSANFESATLLEADLAGANLMNANLRYASLQHAELQGAIMTGANLTRARLERSNLSSAVMHETVLYATNLSQADLSGVHATQIDLRAAKLNGATLDRAELWGAKLIGAFLLDARAHGAQLTRADLTDASLLGADLQQVALTEATLAGTDFGAANMNRATLRDVRGAEASFVATLLIEAVLERAELPQADFEGAYLDYACLAGARLPTANLHDASLLQADLRGAVLANADLRGANLDGALLEDTDLTGVHLQGSRGLSSAQLDGACGTGEIEVGVNGEGRMLRLQPCSGRPPPRCTEAPVSTSAVDEGR